MNVAVDQHVGELRACLQSLAPTLDSIGAVQTMGCLCDGLSCAGGVERSAEPAEI